MDLISLCERAKTAAESLKNINGKTASDVLKKAAEIILLERESLKTANGKDISLARKNGKSDAFIDRLLLSDKVIDSVAEGLKEVADLPSPLGKVLYSYKNEAQGISVEKRAVPFGVIGIIYEARPNVTADAFALCLKTGNAVILKGGSDAINSNVAIVNCLKEALKAYGVDENAVSVIEDTSRETAAAFMKMKGYVDLLIPRGSASLIKYAVENSTVPIIETGAGNCHVYVDKAADVDMAKKVIFNAKTQRYSVCNACESLVIHSDILVKALPEIYSALQEKEVEMRLDERAYALLCGKPNVIKATEEDFYTEYGGPIISVKTVDSVEEAVSHINTHSTGHSESIITADIKAAEYFMNGVDSSTVYHNASTRFTDGFVFGLGAEIGISTQKLHARGPMGLDALVTTKYFVKGDGAVRK